MNKQKLIEKYKLQLKDRNPFGELVSHDLIVSLFLDDLKQLDEPQKPVVPQFVADWYEENKDDFERNLFRSINTISSMYEDEELNEFEDWVIGAYTKPFQTLVNMHQFGYEVEKEKRYFVKIKGVVCPYLNYDTINELWFYNQKNEGIYTKTQHTRKKLEEAGFGEVFNSPLFEVEEVEE